MFFHQILFGELVAKLSQKNAHASRTKSMKQRFFEENHPFQLIIQIGLNYLRGVHICGGGGGATADNY